MHQRLNKKDLKENILEIARKIFIFTNNKSHFGLLNYLHKIIIFNNIMMNKNKK